MKRNWKRVQPASLQEATRLCIDHAKEVHHRSVDGIAALMGLSNQFTLYKYIESGGMPTRLLPVFEHACGCDFVTRWLAHSRGSLLIKVPTGRSVKPHELGEIHQSFIDSIGALARFYEGKEGAQETLNRVTEMLESLAWHHGNVQQHIQPTLDFDGGEK
ncbi:MAG: hypothetical protein PHH47_10085 [Gallionella sp.]|nr:hypothetical protein [Gallionella sp.]MDD4946449.1 hypothetical protein [Gallionella sp.]MDD5613268.1 hypothetical protein [Gallionella sp.]